MVGYHPLHLSLFFSRFNLGVAMVAMVAMTREPPQRPREPRPVREDAACRRCGGLTQRLTFCRPSPPRREPQAMVHCDGMVLVWHDHRFGTHSARAIMVRCDGMVLGVWWAMVGARRARDRCVGAARAVAMVAPRVARIVVATDALCCASEQPHRHLPVRSATANKPVVVLGPNRFRQRRLTTAAASTTRLKKRLRTIETLLRELHGSVVAP